MMMMRAVRKLSLYLASMLALGLFAGTAQAKRAQYEIGGVTYTYNTKNRLQIEMARQRIEAANRVDDIKAKAAAEAASNPFVRLFGSRIQAEVPAAEAELQRLLADRAPSRFEAYAVERQVRREVRIERRRIALESRAKKRQQAGGNARAAEPAVSAGLTKPQRAEPAIKSVHEDRSTGLKTTFLSDGSVREEPMDREAHLMSFVDQLRAKTSSDPISQRLRTP
jgi:hypothetical protein